MRVSFEEGTRDYIHKEGLFKKVHINISRDLYARRRADVEQEINAFFAVDPKTPRRAKSRKPR